MSITVPHFIQFCSLIFTCPFRNYFSSWEDYTLPLIDTTLGAGLLDFIDFHAYDTDATALVSTTRINNTALVYVEGGRH